MKYKRNIHTSVVLEHIGEFYNLEAEETFLSINQYAGALRKKIDIFDNIKITMTTLHGKNTLANKDTGKKHLRLMSLKKHSYPSNINACQYRGMKKQSPIEVNRKNIYKLSLDV